MFSALEEGQRKPMQLLSEWRIAVVDGVISLGVGALLGRLTYPVPSEVMCSSRSLTDTLSGWLRYRDDEARARTR